MVWKEIKQIKADPIMSRLIVIPVSNPDVVLGYAITTEVKNTTLTIVDKCNSPHSRSLIRISLTMGSFACRLVVVGKARRRNGSTRGRLRIALVLPQDFSLALGRDLDATVASSWTDRRQFINRCGRLLDFDHHGVEQETPAKEARRQGLRIENLLPVRVSPVILLIRCSSPRGIWSPRSPWCWSR